MAIAAGLPIDPDDFIDESTADPVPANNQGKVPKLEANGKFSPQFAESGSIEMIAGETINGATTPVPVYMDLTTHKVGACWHEYNVGAGSTIRSKFLGFAITNAVLDGTITVKVFGVVEGFTGLTPNATYFLAKGGTPGLIDTTGSWYNSKAPVTVGVAISATSLLIQKGTRRYIDTESFDDTTVDTAVIECGFKPSYIRMTAIADLDNSSQVYVTRGEFWFQGSGTLPYSSSGTVYAHNLNGNTTRSAGSGGVGLENQSGTTVMDFELTALDELGFTITSTPMNGGLLGNVRAIIEAFADY